VLANEFLATRLGIWLRLPMPWSEVIEVSGWLIAHTPDLRVEIEERRIPCASGLQLASRYLADLPEVEVFDDLPHSAFKSVANKQDWLQMLPFDKWVGNADSRQALFARTAKQRLFQVVFLDQGDCFNAGQWNFPDPPFMGTYHRDQVYRDVTGWNSFEPTLSRIEKLDYVDLWRFVAEIPQEWYQYDSDALCQLVEALHRRRSLVRGLITEFRHSHCKPFPNWIAGRRSGTATRS
jgi:hypothetical protein